ncbi:hypothetical protein D3Q95_00740 [Salmonella enterica]|nr:hypothetical protein [Salmonella enterica]
MAFELNRLIGDDLKLRVAATLLLKQAVCQHRQRFIGIIADDNNHRFLARRVRINVHIIRLGAQLTALIGHIRRQRETEFAIHQADGLTGCLAFRGGAFCRRFCIVVITGRKPHNQQANTGIFNQIAH